MAARPHEQPAGVATKPRLPGAVIALGTVSLFNDTAGDMINPLLPAFVASVGGGPEVLGLIEGVADAVASFLQLASGYLADRIGRLKAVTFVGYAIAAAARPFLALTTAPWQILLARFGDRLGKGIRGAPRDRLIADVTPEAVRGRAFGYHRAMDNAGALVGPIVVYGMLALGMRTRTVFGWSAVPGLLSLIIRARASRKLLRRRWPGHRSKLEFPGLHNFGACSLLFSCSLWAVPPTPSCCGVPRRSASQPFMPRFCGCCWPGEGRQFHSRWRT